VKEKVVTMVENKNEEEYELLIQNVVRSKEFQKDIE